MNVIKQQSALDWLLPLFIFGVGLVSISVYRPDLQPLDSDRAYLLYMAQGIQRGEPIYQTTTFGYPPLGSMISAAAIEIGSWLHIETYLAPRILGVPLLALTGVLLYFITYRFTHNRWIAVWAGVFNFSFPSMNMVNGSNLEPKLLVQIFLLLMILAIQRQKWFWVGLFLTSAILCWHASAYIVLVPLAFCRTDLNRLKKFILGSVIGGLPALAYLLATHQVDDFYYQGFYLKLLSSDEISNIGNGIWLHRVILTNLLGLQFFLAVLTLFSLIYYFDPFSRHAKQHGFPGILAIDSGGIVLLSFVWFFYTTFSNILAFEITAKWDFIYIHFLMAFWASIGLWFVYEKGGKYIKRPNRRTALVLMTSLIILLQWVSGRSPKYTIDDQIAMVHQLDEHAQNQSYLVINYREYYTLTNQSSPWYILYFQPAFDSHIEFRVPDGCDTFMQDIEQQKYQIFYIELESRNECLDQIHAKLQESSEFYVINVQAFTIDG